MEIPLLIIRKNGSYNITNLYSLEGAKKEVSTKEVYPLSSAMMKRFSEKKGFLKGFGSKDLFIAKLSELERLAQAEIVENNIVLADCKDILEKLRVRYSGK